MEMRKRITLVLASLFLVTMLCFAVGCSEKLPAYYVVAFNSNGGTAIESIEVAEGSTATKPTDPTKVGYTFEGWYLGENKFSFEQPITGETTLTANWTPNTDTAYTVKHLQEKLDGSGYSLMSSDTETLHGTTDAATNAQAKSYAGFTAQAIEQKTIAPDGSTVVEIKYNRNTVKITWMIDGAASEEGYKYGAMPSHEAPSKAADETYTYEFAGWDSELQAVTEEKTYTAIFTPVYINYSVVFKNYDGEIVGRKDDYHYGDAIELPTEAPTKPADEVYYYEFDGWTVADSVNGNLEYTATYTAYYVNYTVVFKNHDGSAEISRKEDYHYGDTVEVPAHSEELPGYTYGWDSEIVAVNGDATYNEVRTPNLDTKYTVEILVAQYDQGNTSPYYHTGTLSYVEKTREFAEAFGLDENNQAQGETDSTVDLSAKVEALKGAKLNEESTATGVISGDGSLKLTVILDFNTAELGFDVTAIRLGEWSCDKLSFTLGYMNGVCGVAIDGIIGNGKEIIIQTEEIVIQKYAAVIFNYSEKSAVMETKITMSDKATGTIADDHKVHGGRVTNPENYRHLPVNVGKTFPTLGKLRQINVMALGGGEKHVFIGAIEKVEFKKESVTYSIENGNLLQIAKPIGSGEISEGALRFVNTNENIDFTSSALLYKYEGETITDIHVAGIVLDLGGIRVSDYKTIKLTFQNVMSGGSTFVYCDGIEIASIYGGAHIVDLKALIEAKSIKSFTQLELSVSYWGDVSACKLYVASIELEVDENAVPEALCPACQSTETLHDKCEHCGEYLCVSEKNHAACEHCGEHLCASEKNHAACEHCGEHLCASEKEHDACEHCGEHLCVSNKNHDACEHCGEHLCASNKKHSVCEYCGEYLCVGVHAECKPVLCDGCGSKEEAHEKCEHCGEYLCVSEKEHGACEYCSEYLCVSSKNHAACEHCGEHFCESENNHDACEHCGEHLCVSEKDHGACEYCGDALCAGDHSSCGKPTGPQSVTYSVANGNIMGITTPLSGGALSEVNSAYFGTASVTSAPALVYTYESADAISANSTAGAKFNLGKINVADYKSIKVVAYARRIDGTNANLGNVFLDSTNVGGYYGGGQELDLIKLATDKGLTSFTELEISLQGWAGGNSYVLYVAFIDVVAVPQSVTYSVTNGNIMGITTPLSGGALSEVNSAYFGTASVTSAPALVYTYESADAISANSTAGAKFNLGKINVADYKSIKVVAYARRIDGTNANLGNVFLDSTNVGGYYGGGQELDLIKLATDKGLTSFTELEISLQGWAGGNSYVLYVAFIDVVAVPQNVTYNVTNGNLEGIITQLGAGTLSQVNYTFANNNEGISVSSSAIRYTYNGEAVTGAHATGMVFDFGRTINVADYASIKVLFQTTGGNGGGTCIFLDSTDCGTEYGGAHIVDLKAKAEAKGLTSFSKLELSMSSWANVSTVEINVAYIEFVVA